MHFTSRFGFKLVFKKCCEWPCQGSYHPSTYSLAGSLSEKNNVAVTMFLTVATGWFRFWNYHEFQWIVSNTKPKDVIPDCSIWFSSYLPQQPTMNNRTTEKVNHHTTTTLAVDKRMNQVAFLQILVPGSETLPTSANICLLNQPLLSKPLLVVAVDIHLTCASLTQSGGARMGRQDSQSFVMLRCSCFFVIMSYHVSDIFHK